MADHRLVFIGGLHRSGTTPLARVLATHPQVSGFSGTAAEEDEGQHLQTVYPAAREFGGPGRFGYAPAAHRTEATPGTDRSAADALLDQWRPHWDLDRPVLVEKSPPNLLMTRWLQALFPESYQVVVVRHPVVVTLSTRKWARRTTYRRLAGHWFRAHDLFAADAPHLRRLHVVKYEDLVAEPEKTLDGVARFLRLDGPISADSVQGHRSSGYEKTWNSWRDSANPVERLRHRRLVDLYGTRARAYGYDMRDLSAVEPFGVP